jgi:hypothetical protein
MWAVLQIGGFFLFGLDAYSLALSIVNSPLRPFSLVDFADVHLTCSISVYAKNPWARVTARGDEVACRRGFVFFKPPHALRMKQLGTA